MLGLHILLAVGLAAFADALSPLGVVAPRAGSKGMANRASLMSLWPLVRNAVNHSRIRWAPRLSS